MAFPVCRPNILSFLSRVLSARPCSLARSSIHSQVGETDNNNIYGPDVARGPPRQDARRRQRDEEDVRRPWCVCSGEKVRARECERAEHGIGSVARQQRTDCHYVTFRSPKATTYGPWALTKIHLLPVLVLIFCSDTHQFWCFVLRVEASGRIPVNQQPTSRVHSVKRTVPQRDLAEPTVGVSEFGGAVRCVRSGARSEVAVCLPCEGCFD